jgi:hypothetical protein
MIIKLKNKIIQSISWAITFVLVKLKFGDKIFLFSKGSLLGSSLFFKVHSLAIENIYGPSDKIATGRISQDLLEELLSLQLEIGTQTFEDATKDHEGGLLVTKHSEAEMGGLAKNLIIYNLHKLTPDHPTIRKLHAEIRKMFTENIKCPFIFVNTRMWNTKPNAELDGPNSMHVDGFEAGHQKIMIYLTPMDFENGYLKFGDGQEINNCSSGKAVLFSNSDILHSGVPGLQNERKAIEVTIMHAFLSSPQLNNSHFFGRHLLDPVIAYDAFKPLIKKHLE